MNKTRVHVLERFMLERKLTQEQLGLLLGVTKARVSQHGTPAETAKVNAAVARRYPGMGHDAHPHLDFGCHPR